MKYNLLIILLFSFAPLFSQGYNRNWHDCFDNGDLFARRAPVQASATDGAGDLYVTGFVNLHGDPLNDSVYLKKYSSAGNLLWQLYEPFRKSDDPGNNLGVSSVALAIDRSGNIILSYPYSFTPPDMDAVVNKYSPAGKRLWQAVFDGPVEVDNTEVRKLNTDQDGNIYLLASRNYSYYFFADIVKFNSRGTQLWSRDVTGVIDFNAKDATLDSSGNVYVTGYGYVSQNEYYQNILTYKFLPNGRPAWRKQFKPDYQQAAYRVMYAKDDNSVVVCGHTGLHGDSILAVKYKADGRLLWSYLYKPDAPQTFDQSVIDADNNILIASSQAVGATYRGPFLAKVSATGSPLWSKYSFDKAPAGELYRTFDLKTDAQNNYYTIINQPKGFRIQKMDSGGALLAQTNEDYDTLITADYGGLNIGSNQSIYSAVSYDFYYARTNSCVSKYAMKNAAVIAENSPRNSAVQLSAIPEQMGSLYPNPAHDVVYFSAPGIHDFPFTLYVFDALGKQVMTKAMLFIAGKPPGNITVAGYVFTKSNDG